LVVSRADNPASADASSKRTSSPSTTSVVHASLAPEITIAAKPQRRSTAEKWLDDSPSLSSPVNGEIVASACLFAAGTGVDANGPAASTIGFRGPSGSSGPKTRSSINRTASATPPSASANTSSPSARRRQLCVVRSTSSRSRGPAKPSTGSGRVIIRRSAET
jgi:hypothetical protein